MSRFNTRSTGTKIENLAGGQGFSQTPKLELVSLLLTSFTADQFYRSGSESIDTLRNLINAIPDKKFVAKAAIYARKEFGMRSITHVVAGELANKVKGETWTKKFYQDVINRPDDVTEILSYYVNTYGKPIPNSLKKGLGSALSTFNDYRLAKYRGEGKDISMVDAVNLLHPKATESLTKLIKGELKSTETWESKLSASQGDEDLKNKAWGDLLKENKLPYFALLRNLRNILEQSPESLPLALEQLVNETAIKKSLVLPFRFITAIKEIQSTNLEGSRDVLIALNKAIDISLSNVPVFDGKTLVVLDTSGSMEGRPSEIGSLFSAILVKTNNADFMTFSDSARYQTLNPMDSTLTIANSIDFASGGTNFNSIFEEANKSYDRIIILSDMQGWVGYYAPTTSFNEYKKRLGTNPKIYSFDLAGYGSMEFPEPNVYCLAGFSEKVFDIMKMLEQDKNALVNKIENIEL